MVTGETKQPFHKLNDTYGYTIFKNWVPFITKVSMIFTITVFAFVTGGTRTSASFSDLLLKHYNSATPRCKYDVCIYCQNENITNYSWTVQYFEINKCWLYSVFLIFVTSRTRIATGRTCTLLLIESISKI